MLSAYYQATIIRCLVTKLYICAIIFMLRVYATTKEESYRFQEIQTELSVVVSCLLKLSGCAGIEMGLK